MTDFQEAQELFNEGRFASALMLTNSALKNRNSIPSVELPWIQLLHANASYEQFLLIFSTGTYSVADTRKLLLSALDVCKELYGRRRYIAPGVLEGIRTLAPRISYLLEDEETALEIAREVARSLPGNELAQFSLGQILCWDDQYEEAINALSKALTLSELRQNWLIAGRACYNLALANKKTGAGEELIVDLLNSARKFLEKVKPAGRVSADLDIVERALDKRKKTQIRCG